MLLVLGKIMTDHYLPRHFVIILGLEFSNLFADHVINSAAKTLYMSGGDLNVPIVFR